MTYALCMEHDEVGDGRCSCGNDGCDEIFRGKGPYTLKCPFCPEVIVTGFRDFDDMDMHISEKHPENNLD